MKSLRLLLLDVNRVTLDTSIDMIEYPLGLLSIATALKEAFGDGIDIRIESYEEKSWPEEKLEAVFKEFPPEILGLRSLTMGRGSLHRIASLAKDRFAVPLVIAGGPHATDSPGDVLQNTAFDCAVLGEGEQSAVEIVSGYLSHRPLTGIRGIALRSESGIFRTPAREPISDLDSLPLPDHSLVDFLAINRNHVDFSFRYNTPHANLFTSRGCPYRCIYCHNVFGKTFRGQSAERIMTEIRCLNEEYGITSFQIIDDIFNLDKERAIRFFDLVVRSGLKLVFSFPNGLRGDRVDQEMVEAMWAAGVRYIAYAVESGSPRIQRLIQKNMNLERIAEAISLTTARGIVTRGFFMFGFPSETEEEALMTVKYAKESELVLAMFFTVVYFPGTPLFKLAQRLAPLVKNTLGLEDDYVRTREGPYAFPRETLDKIKLQAIREFFFSPKRLNLSSKLMPNFYAQRDTDASMLVNIISGRLEEKDITDPGWMKKLHRYFLIAGRFSDKKGFFV
jgi:anaerobic magnesium-protoporphyrin IX monomethyl ester cyclase